MTKTRKHCKSGYVRSSTDKHKRCVKIINRSVCSKMNKEYASDTKKCRIPCKSNQHRVTRKDKRGTRCIMNCGKNQVRGKKYCRIKCPPNKTYKNGHCIKT